MLKLVRMINNKQRGEKEEVNLQTNHQVCKICDWPTDTASIAYHSQNGEICPNTILLFVPGNPGCVGWYLDMLHSIIKRLGKGYAARAVSYAGHGVGDDMIRVDNAMDLSEGECQKSQASKLKGKAKIAFTIDGQVEHKIKWVDSIISEFLSMGRELHFIFLTHSIGAHLVQRLLLLRKDILMQTKHTIHITPFHRFHPEHWWQRNFLSTVANAPSVAINVLKLFSLIASRLPPNLVDLYLEKIGGIPEEKDRKLARELYSQSTYAHNFLILGTEEIREIPEVHDLHAMRSIGKVCPTSILYCSEDHWAPIFHMDDIIQAKKQNFLPSNISVELNEKMVHGFTVNPEMIPAVVDFVVNSIISFKVLGGVNVTRSKL